MQITLELTDDRAGGASLVWWDSEHGEDIIWKIYSRGTFKRTADGLRGEAGAFDSLASDLLDVLKAVAHREEKS